MSQRPALRFAPSPNGRLHLGHAYSALTVDAWARRLGGRFLLRIEDTDPLRSQPDLVEGIFEDLAWLGLAWETPVLKQSEHAEVYGAAARTLAASGLLYACFASRGEIAAAAITGHVDPDGSPLYPGICRGLGEPEIAARIARGERYCVRIDMAKALRFAARKTDGAPLTFRELAADGASRLVCADPARWGDAVMVRKDGSASYHLAVVVDDARQQISHVTRGRDLFAATDIHRLLQVLLDLPEPLYHHHALILDRSGRKLAKSKGDIALATLRAEGETAESIRARFARQTGSDVDASSDEATAHHNFDIGPDV